MKYIIYFVLGAFALRLLDTLWQMVVGTPVVECDGGMEFVVTYEADTTPPWYYEIFWN